MHKINETAFRTALDAVQEAFEAEGEEEAQARACIIAYMDEIAPPAATAFLRMDPKDNPNKVTHVNINLGTAEPAWGFGKRDIELVLADGIHALCALTHVASYNAGWYKDPKTGQTIERNLGEVIALMHSELSEALEGARKGLMDDHLPHRLQVEVEFADTVIRIGDTCGHLGLDLAGAIIDKMAYNAHRLDHKLETRAAGGKAF